RRLIFLQRHAVLQLVLEEIAEPLAVRCRATHGPRVSDRQGGGRWRRLWCCVENSAATAATRYHARGDPRSIGNCKFPVVPRKRCRLGLQAVRGGFDRYRFCRSSHLKARVQSIQSWRDIKASYDIFLEALQGKFCAVISRRQRRDVVLPVTI